MGRNARVAAFYAIVVITGLIVVAMFILSTRGGGSAAPTTTPTPIVIPTSTPNLFQAQPIATNTPLPTSTFTPLPTATLADPCPGTQQAPYFFEFTYPQTGASVTYPLHIAGYLHPPDNLPVELQFIIDHGGAVRATGTTTSVPWGDINVVIFNLSTPNGELPLTSGSATLTVKDTATGLCLVQRQVRLIGEDQAGRVTFYLYDRATGALVPREHWVPTGSAGSNLALAELFWGLTPEEINSYQTYIPSPEQIYEYLGETDPINAIVHVRDSYVSAGGVAVLTLSEGILATASSSRSYLVDQIQQTLLQFSNVSDVAIAVGGGLWQPASLIVPTATPVPQVVAPTASVPVGFQIYITSPQPNQNVSSLFHIRGNATVPPADGKLVMELRLPNNQTLTQNVAVVGAQVGQIGTFDTHISYTGVPEAATGTLILSYTDPSTGRLTAESISIQLSPSP